MENVFAPYECQFSIEERKKIVAQTLQEIRKAKNYSQKEVAALLGISQPRYSGYETGRSEPPVEILVRLSYLYGVSVDMLTQRDRMHRTSEDVQKQLEQIRQQIAVYEQQLTEDGGDNPTVRMGMELMKNLLHELERLNDTPSIAEQLESTLDKTT